MKVQSGVPLRRLLCVTLGVIVVCILATSTYAPGEEESPPIQQIQADELTSKRVQIIGRLGYPLGEMLTIRGRWQRPDSLVKDNSLRFVVTEVAGEKLAASVTFHRGLVHLPHSTTPESLEGKPCELRGYEGGGIRGAPDEFYERPVQQPYGFGFRTNLHTASLKILEKPTRPSKAKAAVNEPRLVEEIQADDLTSRRAQIIGRLGYPLGEMVTIRGQWKPPGRRVKDPAFHFVVTEVEGKKLATPVDFHSRGVFLPRHTTPDSLVGKICELRGYERGSFWGDPGRFHREQAGLEGDGESPVADPWGFKFVTEFHASSVKAIDSVRQQHKTATKSKSVHRQTKR